MSTLYIDRKELEIRLDGKSLALYCSNKRQSTVPLGILDRLIITGNNITLSSNVIATLASLGIAVIILAGRHQQKIASIWGTPHNDASIRLGQYYLSQDKNTCLNQSRHIIRSKFIHQLDFIKSVKIKRKDLRKPLSDFIKQINHYIQRLEETTSIDSLLGLEGASASSYFTAYKSIFPPALSFTNRNRRPPRDPINSILSLSYTLLHYEAVQNIYKTGLDPYIGFYHQPSFGRESLACDLIEPLRPICDKFTYNLFRSSTLRIDHFSIDEDKCLLTKTGRAYFYKAWEEQNPVIRRYLRLSCRNLAKYIKSESK